jgi:NhaP-type Na+/H+ or K+/H+ antiporter
MARVTTTLLAFAALLLVAVLVSSLAHRTILSVSVLFLAGGFVLGEAGFGLVPVGSEDDRLFVLAELALFGVLFTDGMRVGVQDLRRAWRLPGRALLLGMPLTFVITSGLAHWLAGLDWTDAFLVGAVLAPTDPVFAAAIVGREEIPGRLRHLLNVESGVNDGLALPVVIVLLAAAGGSEDSSAGGLLSEIGLGLLIGVAVPLVAIWLERRSWLSASTLYEPLNALAIGLLVLALLLATKGNLFLGAFSAGMTVATTGPQLRVAFDHFGELVAELLKLAALMVFGAALSWEFFGDISAGGWLFVVLVLLAARPAALLLALVRSRLNRRERLAAAWFGPKGFASVVYGLLVLESGIDGAAQLYHLIAVVIVLSILAHSSTDVLVARWFDDAEAGADQPGADRRDPAAVSEGPDRPAPRTRPDRGTDTPS